MLKKRLIFVLYFDSGSFCLSRNFRLQRVGDARWLVDKFRFATIGKFVDEIVVLDVSRDPAIKRCQSDAFLGAVSHLMKETFVPLTIGGGLRSISDARACFSAGADKILFNTPAITQPDLVRDCVSLYGSQAVVVGVDVHREDSAYVSKLSNCQVAGLPLQQHLQCIEELGVGEVLVNSIDRDGTGVGFDSELISQCLSLPVPLIVAGGAGKPEHFAAMLALPNVEAAATGNLFNFIGRGFESVRTHLLDKGFPVRSATL